MNTSPPFTCQRGALRRTALRLLAASSVLLSAGAAAAGATTPAQNAAAPQQHLRIVGGLAGVNQYTRHEEPFWTTELPRLSGGRATAEIIPFDRAGIRGQEMLRLIQLGVVPFGNVPLSVTAADDPELTMPDLAGLNPDMATLRRTVGAFRPHLERVMRERYGSELLALYAYPAQVTYCAKSLRSLADLAGRRVRTSSVTQSDWVTSLGGKPVQTAFAEVVANIRNGNIDCAITGTMSGNTIGLHEVTSHLHTAPVNWGVGAFIANGAAWQALPADLQELLRRELPRLERAIWAEAEAETSAGIACNTGAASCTNGRRGQMTEVRTTPQDAARQQEALVKSVLPGWLKRCGAHCADSWKRTVGQTSGFALPAGGQASGPALP
jgi:TRAP-type C4-dicarboxylate transport system substrate-binding protein